MPLPCRKNISASILGFSYLEPLAVISPSLFLVRSRRGPQVLPFPALINVLLFGLLGANS